MDGEDAVSLQPTDDQSHSFIGVFRHYLDTIGKEFACLPMWEMQETQA